MQNADLGWFTQRLVHNAITLSQSNQRGELFFAGVSVQNKVQSNLFKTDGHILGNAQRPGNRDRLPREWQRHVTKCQAR